MKQLLILPILLLGACSHIETVQPTTKRFYVPVTISEEFLDPNKCPWPDPDQYIVKGTNVEVGEWIVAGKNAWTCEHITRMNIGKQNAEQKADIEKRNNK